MGTIAARKDYLYDGLKRTDRDLRQMQATLEKQVQERTQELSETNESLKKEIIERNKAEDSLMLARFSIEKPQTSSPGLIPTAASITSTTRYAGLPAIPASNCSR